MEAASVNVSHMTIPLRSHDCHMILIVVCRLSLHMSCALFAACGDHLGL